MLEEVEMSAGMSAGIALPGGWRDSVHWPLANHVRAVLASRYADLEGNGARDLDQAPAEAEGVAGGAATAVAAASGRDTTPACAAGGTARAAPAHSVRAIRGESSC
jgi:hypothetical protein